MLLTLLSALAAEPDRAWTGVGVQGVYSPPAQQGELDLVLSERLRWTLWEQEQTTLQLRADARFTVDPFRGTKVETARVRELGVHLSTGELAVDLGRSPVAYGGPRLVDGVQLHKGLGPAWTVGFWAGEAPDLYTTRPAPRFGGGPILVYQLERHQISLVGEVLTSDAGFDRAGLLLQGRTALNRRIWVDTRLDLQTVSEGTPLADAAVFLRYQPSPSLRIGAFYDAHSTWRYLSTQDRDPALQRFASRSQELGLSEDIPQDSLDPTLYQLVGLSGRWDSTGRLSLQLEGRYRHHALADRRYARVGPRVGFQATDELLLTVDAFALYASEETRTELGVTAWYQPDRPFAVDGSARLLLSPQLDPGFYADGFVSWVAPGPGLSVAAGLFTHGQSDSGFTDTAVGGLARLTWRLRGS